MRTAFSVFATSLLLAFSTFAQDLGPLKTVKYRQIGPFRGGRVVAVAGVDSQPNVFYFGGTGGGVWKTTDAGNTWESISDGQPFGTGDVGAIAVADSDPNVIYVGMGETPIRGNVSHGDGVYKSTDAGRTWKHIGLEATRQIGRIRIHPKNPDIAYACALGHVWAPNEERGIYKTTDGGKTWKQIYTRGPKAGCADLTLDPSNPSVLWAGFWEAYRKPWLLESGGPGSALVKSTDGGETWTDLTRSPGLPKGLIGTIGVAVSPVNSDRVFASIEAEDGGIFRTDDGGKKWIKVNDERKLRQRAWYYSRLFCDPKNEDVLYGVNVGFFKSIDGGKTFSVTLHPPHGDNHEMWIAPSDPNRFIEGNDGGANITLNGGKTWSSIMNQPTAQFYRVSVDDQFPYWIYGAQQDNTTVKIVSRTSGSGIGVGDWYPVGGGESGWIAGYPKDPEIVFAGNYDGLITRYDHRTGQTRDVTVWPDNPMGHGVEDMKYRFQWNFPILFSPHDPDLLYAGGNVLFTSTNQGQTWKAISPDLTRNDKSKQGPSGGPITKDNSAVEYYDTIFTVAESPAKKGVIWAGSDDGLVHVTQDGGAHWSNVTPKGIPEWIQINSIEASPFDPAVAYFAATMYKFDDYLPYLYKTSDYGKSWTAINNGIPADAFTRVIREDPNQKGLLFAGTETGIYVSFDNGASWKSLQLNLPITPVTDIAIQKREQEMVVATQGRSFWIFDDMQLLHQLSTPPPAGPVLFKPKAAYRITPRGGFGGGRGGGAMGANPASGAVIYYNLPAKAKDASLEFLDAQGKLIRKFTNKEEHHDEKLAGSAEEEEDFGPRPEGTDRIPDEAGMNRFVWNLRYPDAIKFPGMVLWSGSTRGPLIVPGTYTVKLTYDGKSASQTFDVVKDPRINTTQEQYLSQLELELQIRDKLNKTHEAIINIRSVRHQVEELAARVENPEVAAKAKALIADLTSVEEALYQTKNKANEDPLNFPIRLNNKMASLLAAIQSADAPPTSQEQQVFEDITTGINAQLKKLNTILTDQVPAFNKLVKQQDIPAVSIKTAPPPGAEQ
jgi:photosystem II stability/assembly factor-like uncharacterized protein